MKNSKTILFLVIGFIIFPFLYIKMRRPKSKPPIHHSSDSKENAISIIPPLVPKPSKIAASTEQKGQDDYKVPSPPNGLPIMRSSFKILSQIEIQEKIKIESECLFRCLELHSPKVPCLTQSDPNTCNANISQSRMKCANEKCLKMESSEAPAIRLRFSN